MGWVRWSWVGCHSSVASGTHVSTLPCGESCNPLCCVVVSIGAWWLAESGVGSASCELQGKGSLGRSCWRSTVLPWGRDGRWVAPRHCPSQSRNITRQLRSSACQGCGHRRATATAATGRGSAAGRLAQWLLRQPCPCPSGAASFLSGGRGTGALPQNLQLLCLLFLRALAVRSRTCGPGP